VSGPFNLTQPITQPITESVAQPIAKPITESVAQPVAQPVVSTLSTRRSDRGRRGCRQPRSNIELVATEQ